MRADELDMGYRHTALHESGDVVVDVTIKLQKGNKEETKEKAGESLRSNRVAR